MAKSKRGVGALLTSSQSGPAHAKYRHSPKQLAAAERDLKEIVAAEDRVRLSRQRIADFLAAEHGVVVTVNTIGGWLNKIRRGQSIL